MATNTTTDKAVIDNASATLATSTKTVAKKPVAKKPAAKKAAASKPVAKKVAAKKVSAKTSAKNIEASVSEAVEEIGDEVSAQANSVRDALNENVAQAQKVAKQAWYVYLGALGRSVEEIQGGFSKANDELSSRFQELNNDSQKMVKDLAVRGEKVQDDAEALLKDGRANIEEQIEVAKGKVNDLATSVDIPARLKNISAKLEALSNDLKKSA